MSIKRIVNPKKLLNSKWTPVTPTNKEKHFMVTKFVLPELASDPITLVELEAVHSQRKQIIVWQALNDTNVWLQGWL
jgi:tryptophan-rich hypothetical protein